MPSSYTYTVGPDGKVHAAVNPVIGQLSTPEGRPSPIRIDAAGNRIVDSEQQLSVLTQIDPPPERPSMEKAYQMAVVNAQVARQDAAQAKEPASPAELEIASRQAMGKAEEGTGTIPQPPRTQAERDERTSAAARLAASLGRQLVWVNDDPVLKVPAHLEVRDAIGNCYAVGPLEIIESRLAIDARQRAASDRAVKLIEAQAAQRARAQAEAVASSPAARFARLEADNAALQAALAELAAANDAKTAELIADGFPVSVLFAD